MKLRNALILALTAFIWGTSFVAQSVGMDYIGPFTFNGVRSFIGAITLIPFILIQKKFQRKTKRTAKEAPENKALIDQEKMQKTLVRAAQNWNWSGGSWSWNYPTLAMNATRLLQPEVALRAITMDNREDLLLPSGNNYRSTRLRSYLPGNGGLLLAVSMMCAGWDGCSVSNPGFPKDGKWNVRWEGLHPMP